MTQLAVFAPSRRMSQRLYAANAPVRYKAPGRIIRGRAMSGTFTDGLKAKLPMIALLLGGILIGYFARKPIGKLVDKVT